MHEGGRTERRLSGSGRVQLDAEYAGDRVPVDRGGLHEQVVGMLAVVQRDAAVGLAALEEKRQRLLATERRRFCREHHAKGELALE